MSAWENSIRARRNVNCEKTFSYFNLFPKSDRFRFRSILERSTFSLGRESNLCWKLWSDIEMKWYWLEISTYHSIVLVWYVIRSTFIGSAFPWQKYLYNLPDTVQIPSGTFSSLARGDDNWHINYSIISRDVAKHAVLLLISPSEEVHNSCVHQRRS